MAKLKLAFLITAAFSSAGGSLFAFHWSLGFLALFASLILASLTAKSMFEEAPKPTEELQRRQREIGALLHDAAKLTREERMCLETLAAGGRVWSEVLTGAPETLVKRGFAIVTGKRGFEVLGITVEGATALGLLYGSNTLAGRRAS